MQEKEKRKKMTRTGINFYKKQSDSLRDNNGKTYTNNFRRKSQPRIHSERIEKEEISKINSQSPSKNKTEILNKPILLSESINMKKNITIKSSIIAKENEKNLIKTLIKEFDIHHRRFIGSKECNISQNNILKKKKNKIHLILILL